MNAIMQNPTPQLPMTPSKRTAPVNQTQTLIRTMNGKEVQELSRVARFFVFLPAPIDDDGMTQSQMTGSHSDPESSTSLDVLKLFQSAVAQARTDQACCDILVGDVKINFSTMEAARMGEPLSLTALEFKTLKYLIENARRVISRDELLNEVWGYQNYPSTRTVDNQVSKLRKKLEQNPSRPVHLRTVHGAGYKFLP
jgi:hypothetical protein